MLYKVKWAGYESELHKRLHVAIDADCSRADLGARIKLR